MKCHIENATGTSPIASEGRPVTLAGTKAAAKEMTRRIHNPLEDLVGWSFDVTLTCDSEVDIGLLVFLDTLKHHVSEEKN
jgi:hypothetical protein